MSRQSDARALLSAGLSVIPIRPKRKRALLEWKKFHNVLPTVSQIDRWWAANPDANIAIVGGASSRGLLILDADDPDFVAYLLDRRKDLEEFWAVETGSHKLHLYCRTRTDFEGENLTHGTVHLGEIRGQGQYVLAPPSRVVDPKNDPDHDQAYKTLWGSPQAIPIVKDAKALFKSIVAEFLRTQGSKIRKRLDTAAPKNKNRVLPELQGRDRKALYNKIKRCPDLDSGTKNLILNGIGETAYTSRSHAAWGAVKGLVVAEFTEEEIENVLATFPIGEGCYRNTQRPGSFGWTFCQITLDAVHKKLGEEDVAAETASGENFKIERVTKKMYDTPTYMLQVSGPSSGDVEVECEIADLLSEARLRQRLAQELNYVPEFTLTGKRFRHFSDSILRMARIEMIPEEAKTSGVIRAWVIEQLTSKSRMATVVPTDEHNVALGWSDPSNGHVYAKGGKLLNMAQISLNPRPTPSALWQVVESMGGEEVDVEYTDTGHHERTWAVPTRSLKR